MKKILALILAGLCGVASAQNPTVVRPTNGLENATAATTGVVYPRMKTNNQNNAVQQVYGHTAAGAFQWYDASTFGATPGGSSFDIQFNNAGAFGGTNAFTLLLPGAGVARLTNVVGSLEIASKGPMTNSAPSYFLNTAGAITLGDGNAVQMFRETTGLGWSVRTSANANITWKIGGTLGYRGAAVTGNSTIGSGDTSIVYAEDASSGQYNHILPAIGANDTKIFHFYKNDNTQNEIHICTASGTLMSNGQTNYVLYSPGDSVTIWNNSGTTWDIIESANYPKFFSWFHKDSEIVTGNALTVGVLATQVNDEQTFQNAAASNDTFRVKAYLARGTNYHLYALGTTDSSRGIQRWQITDGAGTRTIDSMDWYNVINQLNIQKTSAAFSVLQPGYVVFTSTVTNKNASSSDFVIALTRMKISEP